MEDPRMNRAPAPPEARLRCLDGQPAPADVVRDWRRLLDLPDKARQGLWEILAPSLAGAVDAAMEKRAEAFCRLYDLSAPDLQASLRVCRFVLSRASSLDLAATDVAADVAALSGDDARGVVVLSWYEAAKAVIRRGILEESIFDHGKVLVGLDWRVDRIAGSDRGVHLDAPLAVLTLRLRDGGRDERTTIYVAPPALGQIKEACDRIERMIAGAPRPPSGAPKAQG
ncbi:hypothetical protein BE21_43615 [Sorangium cellulosum]|uniref:COMM domain-containing protein n=1 Tax=Sorangium cellulosum TaxID=56 RepID=A0A150TJX2_SORCE|nr:hypothetical protein BE21_43615 [Sorangium cellulosum]